MNKGGKLQKNEEVGMGW